MSDTTLTLGDFQFTGLEIPEQISGIGISQQMHVHRLLGGDRSIDVMGQDFRPIEWSGLFFGADALSRLAQLKAIAASGEAQALSWHNFSYLVIVREVSAEERRQFEIPYHISCEIVADNASPIAGAPPQSIDDAVQQGMSAAQIQVQLIDDENLTEQMGLLATAIAAVDSFSEIESSLLTSVLAPLTTMRNIVSALQGTSATAIDGAQGFAGMSVGEDALTLALALDSTESALFDELELVELDGILGVMQANITAANGSPNTVATAGGNLFAIASKQYGDTDAWTAIATANGLTDPFITGTAVLTLPLAPKDTGGVLSV